MKNILIFVISIFIIVPITACNQNEKNDDQMIIKAAWARPALMGNPSAVYFQIENRNNETDRLISVESQIAEFNEIHLSSMQDGTMKMMKQDFVEIKANQKLEFKPMSYHVMLINLNQDLNPGDQFEISLFFEKSGEKTISVEVKENE